MEVYVGDLPIWLGVQDKPGKRTVPFTFKVDEGLVRCTLPPEELEFLVKEYGEDSYNYRSSPPGTSNWGNTRGSWFFDYLAEKMKDLAGKRVLEVGAGTLYMANRVIDELNVGNYIACDPSLTDTNLGDRMEVIREYFSYEKFKDENFDLAISICVMEHLPDPVSHIRELHKLLSKNGGKLFTVVPDCKRALVGGDPGICIHEHLTYFTPESFRGVLESVGFIIEDMHSVYDNLFVLARPIDENPPALPEEISKQQLQEFDESIKNNMESIRALFDSLRAKGKVGLHGCGVGLNNVLSLLDINDDENLFLFDGDENKTGKYMTAFEKPILNSKDPKYGEMDAIIVASMSFYEQISEFAKKEHNIKEENIFPILPNENN